jgi:hypothetical protein
MSVNGNGYYRHRVAMRKGSGKKVWVSVENQLKTKGLVRMRWWCGFRNREQNYWNRSASENLVRSNAFAGIITALYASRRPTRGKCSGRALTSGAATAPAERSTCMRFFNFFYGLCISKAEAEEGAPHC